MIIIGVTVHFLHVLFYFYSFIILHDLFSFLHFFNFTYILFISILIIIILRDFLFIINIKVVT